MRISGWLTFALTFVAGCRSTSFEAPSTTAVSALGMCVSDSVHASSVGRKILASGGNAVDAAVAIAFALAVTWPEAGNIGGGGFMMVAGKDGAPVCIDYRETAPGAATATMFSKSDSRFSAKAVGVPGTVRGLSEAHARFGRLPWRVLVEPAARLARDGFAIEPHLAESTNRVLAKLPDAPRFAELRRVYGKPGGGKWRASDVMQLPELAATLQRIAEGGPDAFYEGEVASDVARAMTTGGGGVITQADLARYRAEVRAAVRGEYRGYEVFGPPPPASGGVCIVQMLHVLEQFDLRRHERFAAPNLHLLIEAMRRAFRDRARYIADPAFATVPSRLTTKSYARELARSIDTTKATKSEAIAGDIDLTEDPSTTHFSVADANGMVVSNTYTLEASWGSRIVVPGRGFLLNNEMGDFNWFPGKTTRKGRIGTEPNTIEPGKRMLSSQSPVIVYKDGKPVLATGSPGGRTIPNTVLGILVSVLGFDMPLARAVAAPRIHHQWFPDVVQLEGADTPELAATVAALRAFGHEVKRTTHYRGQGSAHSIWIDPLTRRMHGVADERRGGGAAGL